MMKKAYDTPECYLINVVSHICLRHERKILFLENEKPCKVATKSFERHIVKIENQKPIPLTNGLQGEPVGTAPEKKIERKKNKTFFNFEGCVRYIFASLL